MSSPSSPVRRRARSDMEDDAESDMIRNEQSSVSSSPGSVKRARTNGYQTGPQPRRRQSYDDDDDEEGEEEEAEETDAGASQFQPGAIVRVKLTNFVTYENAEFFPGPNLNMVIGPNGTGKSSLVCAICLGLGWGPQHLGRAQQVGEFVKHNTNDAYVEIELQRRPEETKNHVVRLRIIRDGNNREWWLDGRKTSLKAVQALTKGFNIQVDNLCQFLPQDKVSEFAALSPVELLQQTQRAAAPEEMLEQHDMLKRLRKDQKSVEQQFIADKDNLTVQESRQESLRVQVQLLEERIQIQENIMVLRKTIPFVEYRIARAQHIKYKEIKEKAQKRLKELEQELGPTLLSITQKEKYTENITVAVRDRKNAVDAAEREANRLTTTIDEIDELIRTKNSALEAQRQAETDRKKGLQVIQRKITGLKARLNNEKPIIFDGPEWNERIRAKEHEKRGFDAEIRDLKSQYSQFMAQGNEIRLRADHVKQELGSLDTQEGQQMSKLESISKETAEAWKWVQDNRDKFEHEVYGPPLISCSVKDPKYTAAIESLFRPNDFLTITAQSKGDFKILSDHLYGTLKLAAFPIRVSDGTGLDDPAPLSPEEMQRFGLDGWALDFIDGPEAVLSMLVGSLRLNRCAVKSQDITPDQYTAIIESGRLSHLVAGSQTYQVSRRAEYGSQAVSTITRNVQPAKHWTDQPINSSAKIALQAKLDALATELGDLKKQAIPMRNKSTELESKSTTLQQEITNLKDEKAVIQKAAGEQATLPTKIQREEDALDQKKVEAVELRNQMKSVRVDVDEALLRKSRHALKYRDLVSNIRARHEDLLEAEIRLIEARSDVEALKERNKDIDEQLEAERLKVRDTEIESRRVKNVAATALRVCQEIKADPDNANYLDRIVTVDENLTVEGLEMEIGAEESKLEFVHANNPNAIKDFEKRQVEVDKLREKISEAEAKLERIGRNISKIRGKWEPALDRLISEISDAFSYNFEQIGCAGEVGIHKDDDFDLWAIQIKVKFRENELLQILDQHRQSGGERSVSTIFYLMSLQSLARAPFRVVDEINQGMDPRNERMVHERMVEIACKEHTSQYFLITPKLLTGLRYDKRMKVLCIASGEYMPANYKRLDVSKIIGIRRAIIAAN